MKFKKAQRLAAGPSLILVPGKMGQPFYGEKV
jgi:hypothetical protein